MSSSDNKAPVTNDNPLPLLDPQPRPDQWIRTPYTHHLLAIPRYPARFLLLRRRIAHQTRERHRRCRRLKVLQPMGQLLKDPLSVSPMTVIARATTRKGQKRHRFRAPLEPGCLERQLVPAVWVKSSLPGSRMAQNRSASCLLPPRGIIYHCCLPGFSLWCLGCSQNCTQAGHPGAGNRPSDWAAIPSSPRR